MDIEHVGDVLVDQLVDAGLVKTFADIYQLKKENCWSWSGWGRRARRT